MVLRCCKNERKPYWNTTLPVSLNKTAKNKNKNRLQFLFIVKSAVLKQQISKFYPKIQRTVDSFYILWQAADWNKCDC